MQIHEILLAIVAYCLGLLIAGYVYSEIWSKRLNGGKFQEGFEELLAKSTIMKKVDNIESFIQDPNFAKNVGKAAWESTRAEKGGTMKGVYADLKKEAQMMAEVEAHKYPGLMRMAHEMDGLIQAGLVSQNWGEKFLVLAQNPTWGPRLEAIANDFFAENGGRSHGSRGNWR